MNAADDGPAGLDAVLLAGGRSLRMGVDKACLRLSGDVPLWRRQQAVLMEAGATTVYLSVRPEQTWAADEPEQVRDSVPDGGPLAGIVSAFERCRSTHLLVLAVDLPNLPARWLRELTRLCRNGAGACGRHADGSFEPLAAVYPVSWLPEWRLALSGRDRALQPRLMRAWERGELAALPIQAEHAAWFHNLNFPGDLLAGQGADAPASPLRGDAKTAD